MEHASDFGLMTCRACLQPVVLTVEQGFCPRCYYRLECQAICTAAEDQVDRVFDEAFIDIPGECEANEGGALPNEQVDWSSPTIPAPARPAVPLLPPLGVVPSSEPAWSW